MGKAERVHAAYHKARGSGAPAEVPADWGMEPEGAQQGFRAVAALPGKPSAETCFLAFARAWPERYGNNPQWGAAAHGQEARFAEVWQAVSELMAGHDDPGATR